MTNLVTQAVSLIHQMDNDQLNQIIDAVKLKRQYITKQSVRALTVGDLVQFNGRNGHTTGRVKKVNRKFVVVDCGVRGTWRVPGNMLTPAEA